MSFEKLLHKYTALNFLEIQIDGISVVSEEIISLDMSQSFFDMKITGELKMKDSFDIFNNAEIEFNGENELTIAMQDFEDTRYFRTFIITKAIISPSQERFRVIDFEFQDALSWRMQNTYLSKSFTDTTVNALKAYMEHTVSEILTADKLEQDIVDTSTSASFVVPQDRNYLEFFKYILKKDNIRIWQDRNKFYCKELALSDLEVPVIEESENQDELAYTDRTLNNEYMFKFHDLEIRHVNLKVVNELPVRRIFRHDFEKVITDDTLNLDDLKADMTLNTADSDFQITTGEKYEQRDTLFQNDQKFELFDVYMKNNELVIAVPGTLKYGQVGQVVNVNLKGNPLNSDSDMEGDIYMSGKYFVTGIDDKIIGDKFIQRIKLIRLDATKPRG